MAAELDAYHDALVVLFKNHFGDSLATVQAYLPETQSDDPEAGLTIKTPALLVEIEKTGQGHNLGDGRVAVYCELAAHCILGTATPKLQQELRNFGVEVQRLLTDLDFCLGKPVSAGMPEDVNGMPGWWQKGGAGGYDSWVVTFEQTVWIGESVWKGDALPGEEVTVFLPRWVPGD